MYVNKVLRQYGLPSTMDLLDASYTKAQWRGMYVQAVDRYWTDKILAEAAEKSSLKYMNKHKYSIGQAQLLLLRCESLTQVRDQFLHKIYQSLQKSVGVGPFDIIKSNDTVLTTTILDCTTLIDDVREPVMDNVLHEIESTARGLCFALHMKHTALLSQSN